MFFGPSMAEIVGHWWQGYFGSPIPAPYATGILDPAVVEELSLFDDLAVALIAISAGGELKLEELKKGLRLILMLVGGQAVAIALMVGGFVLAIGGSIPDIAMPGFGDLTLSQSAALAACAGAISLATSPAATLAVIFDTRSKGEMTSAVLGTVVFKDVAVVILFAFASAWASAELLPGGTDGSLAIKLGVEIFGSIAVGAVVGVVMALYLRFVGRELLIFIPGMIYLATLVAGTAHLNTVLLFLMAGFLIANLPGHGAQLFHSVEQLSLPVFVLFFTLAGAKLHLEELQALWAFAVGLCLMRVAAIWLGVRVATWPTLKNSGEGFAQIRLPRLRLAGGRGDQPERDRRQQPRRARRGARHAAHRGRRHQRDLRSHPAQTRPRARGRSGPAGPEGDRPRGLARAARPW